MMKLSLIAITLSLFIFNAQAQNFNANTTQPKVSPSSSDSAPAPTVKKDNSTTDNDTKAENLPSKQNELSEEMIARGIKTLPPEEVDKMRDDLRDDLRKTTKFDDLKEKINYIEVNNRIDKTLYRRKLEDMGENYNISSRIAERKPKLQINPKSDAQMEKLILERAGVPEDNNNQK